MQFQVKSTENERKRATEDRKQNSGTSKRKMKWPWMAQDAGKKGNRRWSQ